MSAPPAIGAAGSGSATERPNPHCAIRLTDVTEAAARYLHQTVFQQEYSEARTGYPADAPLRVPLAQLPVGVASTLTPLGPTLTIHRHTHNLVHVLRGVAALPFAYQLLLRFPGGKEDQQVHQPLSEQSQLSRAEAVAQFAMLFRVAGRQNETSEKEHPQNYQRFKQAGANAFLTAAATSPLTPQERKLWYQVLGGAPQQEDDTVERHADQLRAIKAACLISWAELMRCMQAEDFVNDVLPLIAKEIGMYGASLLLKQVHALMKLSGDRCDGIRLPDFHLAPLPRQLGVFAACSVNFDFALQRLRQWAPPLVIRWTDPADHPVLLHLMTQLESEWKRLAENFPKNDDVVSVTPSKLTSHLTSMYSAPCAVCKTFETQIDWHSVELLYTVDHHKGYVHLNLALRYADILLAPPPLLPWLPSDGGSPPPSCWSNELRSTVAAFTQQLSVEVAFGDRTSLAHVGEVYRGMSMSNTLIDSYQAQRNNVVYLHSFTSTSLDRAHAVRDFAKQRAEDERAVLLVIRIPEHFRLESPDPFLPPLPGAARAKAISCLAPIKSRFHSEKEVLILPNAGYRVIDVSRAGAAQRIDSERNLTIITLQLESDLHCMTKYTQVCSGCAADWKDRASKIVRCSCGHGSSGGDICRNCRCKQSGLFCGPECDCWMTDRCKNEP